MKKFFITLVGMGAFVLMVALNLRHAFNNYGILDNNLSMEILAQSNTNDNGGGTSGGGTSGGGTSGGGTSGGGTSGGGTSESPGSGASSFEKAACKCTETREETNRIHINTYDLLFTIVIEEVKCTGIGGIPCIPSLKMLEGYSSNTACTH